MTTEPEPTVEVKTVETLPATLTVAAPEPKAAPTPKRAASKRASVKAKAEPKVPTEPKIKAEPKTPAAWADDVQLYGKREPEAHIPSRNCPCEPKLVALPEGDGERIEVRHR